MKISYKKLWVLLAEKEISKAAFRDALELSTGTMTKLNKGEEVSLATELTPKRETKIQKKIYAKRLRGILVAFVMQLPV